VLLGASLSLLRDEERRKGTAPLVRAQRGDLGWALGVALHAWVRTYVSTRHYSVPGS
jgi:hypothetical protein